VAGALLCFNRNLRAFSTIPICQPPAAIADNPRLQSAPRHPAGIRLAHRAPLETVRRF
jgi:hypothetical protein